MTLDQAKAALETQQAFFSETVKQPNTLERNIVLAGFRNEIGRLQKAIASPGKLKQAITRNQAKSGVVTAAAV